MMNFKLIPLALAAFASAPALAGTPYIDGTDGINASDPAITVIRRQFQASGFVAEIPSSPKVCARFGVYWNQLGTKFRQKTPVKAGKRSEPLTGLVREYREGGFTFREWMRRSANGDLIFELGARSEKCVAMGCFNPKPEPTPEPTYTSPPTGPVTASFLQGAEVRQASREERASRSGGTCGSCWCCCSISVPTVTDKDFETISYTYCPAGDGSTPTPTPPSSVTR